MTNVYSLEDIPNQEVTRQLTGIYDFDWMMGYSIKKIGFVEIPVYGVPVGKLTILTGESGTGKTRFALKLAKALLKTPNEVRSGIPIELGYKRGLLPDPFDNSKMNRILYIQNEVTLSELRSWIGHDAKAAPYLKNFYVSSSNTVAGQIADVEKVKPDFVFIDSVNMMDEFKDGRGAKAMIEGANGSQGYKYLTQGLLSSGHLFFISHFSKDGGLKGSTTFPHLVDGILVLERDEDDTVKLRFENKYRYGRSDVTTTWKHTREGLDCISNNRTEDAGWMEFRGFNNDNSPAATEAASHIESIFSKRRKEAEAAAAANQVVESVQVPVQPVVLSAPAKNKNNSNKVVSKPIGRRPLSDEEISDIAYETMATGRADFFSAGYTDYEVDRIESLVRRRINPGFFSKMRQWVKFAFTGEIDD